MTPNPIQMAKEADRETPVPTNDTTEEPAAESEAIQPQIDDGVVYCANHPDTETLLRCNKCNKPICLRCSVQTAVGYRCKECIRGVQDNYFNIEDKDYPIAFVVSMLVTAIAAPIVAIFIGRLGIFFGFILAFLLGSGAGSILAQIIRSAIGKRRGRYLNTVALAGIIVGIFLGVGVVGLLIGGGIAGMIAALFGLFSLQMLIFVVLAAGTARQMLR